MDFEVDTASPASQDSGCVVVGVFEPQQLSHAGQSLDKATNGQLSDLLARGDMDGEAGRAVMIPQVAGAACQRILMVGCGREPEFDERAYRRAVRAMIEALCSSGATDAVSYLSNLPLAQRAIRWRAREAVQIVEGYRYRFRDMKSDPDASPDSPLQTLTLAVTSGDGRTAATEGVREGRAIAKGKALSQDLGNLPANVCTPVYLAERATELSARFDSLSTEIMGADDMDALGMGALRAVSFGSRLEPRLIRIHYQGADKATRPHALIGKGVTFDSGGLSIKPAAAMDEMKYDMAGAASVLGAIHAAAELALELNLVGIIPAVENMPDGAAYRPGDVVTTLSGHTVEIINTDAEGRLALCDALTYSARFEPASIVDMATLTGSCIIALGEHAHGLMGNDQATVDAILGAGRESGDRAWQLPLWPEYDEQLKSNFADFAHVGGRQASTITAGCFLSRFVTDQCWAHLDIAGTSWQSGDQKGATGRPVPLLVQYLLDRIG